MATSRLRPGDQLPTVRELAVELRVNANTVARVYSELERAGVITTKRGVGSFVSGTPPILAMVPLRASLEVIARAGIEAIRAKSVLLTQFAVDIADGWDDAGVRLAGPRDPDRRGGHVTLCRTDFREVNDRLWRAGVIPDFRAPDGIRIGLAPLSTSFAETAEAMRTLRELL